MTREAFTIDEFCQAHGFSRGHYFNLQKMGQGPRVMKAGNRRLISKEAAAEWRAAHTAGSIVTDRAALREETVRKLQDICEKEPIILDLQGSTTPPWGSRQKTQRMQSRIDKLEEELEHDVDIFEALFRVACERQDADAFCRIVQERIDLLKAILDEDIGED